MRRRDRSFDNGDGIEWVCCRICGGDLRVISGRHLGKHNTDRVTYMEEYISPQTRWSRRLFALSKGLAVAIIRT